jgi:hypothetical protein
MINSLQASYKIVESTISEVVRLDGKLSEINSKFKMQSVEDKDKLIDEYCNLLETRDSLLEPIVKFQSQLSEVIEKLDSTRLGFWDNIIHKMRIKKMEKLLDRDSKRQEANKIEEVVVEEVEIIEDFVPTVKSGGKK